jgi:hypothetical protein
MDRLKRNAIMASEPREGITAVEALEEFGEDGVSRLLAISGESSLANTSVKQAANSAIARIKRHSIS